MNPSLHVRIANEFADLASMAQEQRDRYVRSSGLWSYYDGKLSAYRDLCVSVKRGDFAPLDDVQPREAQ